MRLSIVKLLNVDASWRYIKDEEHKFFSITVVMNNKDGRKMSKVVTKK